VVAVLPDPFREMDSFDESHYFILRFFTGTPVASIGCWAQQAQELALFNRLSN